MLVKRSSKDVEKAVCLTTDLHCRFTLPLGDLNVISKM